MKAKFIDATYIKKNSPLQENIDENILSPLILTAQEIHIKNKLGTALYERLMIDVDLFITLGTPIVLPYSTLLNDYIAPCLKEWTIYEVLPYISLKITNKSVSKRNSEFSVPAENFEVKELRNSVRDVAELFTENLTNYLKENKDSFPEYCNPGNGVDTIRPNDDNFFGGIYLG